MIARTFYQKQFPYRVTAYSNFMLNSEIPERIERKGNYTLLHFYYKLLIVDPGGNGQLLIPNISGYVISVQKQEYLAYLLIISLSAILIIFVIEYNLQGLQKLISETAAKAKDDKYL